MPQSNWTDGVTRSRFGIHCNIIFWLLAPLYWLCPRPEILLILTSCACALAGFGIYLISRKKIGNSWWAIIPAVSFWLSPMVQDANLYDFHVVTLATVLFVWMIWAFDSGRIKAGWALLALTLMCKENMPLLIAMYGIYLLLDRKRNLGIAVIIISIFYIVFINNFFVPFFTGGKGLWSSRVNRYLWLGPRLSEAPVNLIRYAPQILSQILQPDRLRIVIYFLLSGGIVAFLGWRMLLLLIPPLMESLLSNSVWTTRITGAYYFIVPEAIIILACILAAQKASFPLRKIILLYLLTVTIFFSLAFSPLPYGSGSYLDNYALNKEAHKVLKELSSSIPPDASICTQNNLGPHFSHRLHIGRFPYYLKTADYVLLYLRRTSGTNSGYFMRPSLAILPGDVNPKTLDIFLESGAADWKLVSSKQGFYLFIRGRSSAQEWEAIKKSTRDDLAIMVSQYIRDSRHESKLAPYLTGTMTWKELRSNWKAVLKSWSDLLVRLKTCLLYQL